MSRPWNLCSIQAFIQLQEVVFFISQKHLKNLEVLFLFFGCFFLPGGTRGAFSPLRHKEAVTDERCGLSVCLTPPHSGPAVWYLTAQWSPCPRLPSRPRPPPQPPSSPMTSSLLHQISTSPPPLPRCVTGKSTFLKPPAFPFYSGFCNASELFDIPAWANPTVLLSPATNKRQICSILHLLSQ